MKKKNCQLLLDSNFSQLKFEITETQILTLENENVKNLKELMNLGIEISLDDFGTGYSSIRNMAFFPVSEVKIDKGFIDYIIEDEKMEKLVSLIIVTAHKLGYTVTAEGVEYKGQLNKLLEYSCDKIQGFYLAKPMSAQDIVEFIRYSNLNELSK
ncbi:EAL domain-containing protein [Caldisalinibacter kiritimatiensis]|uniref:Sensory box protein n=1 Tax=Caldisalinibacter kiritimatiensis TaxID=1304284 RepID=R1ATW6_9FIRM|nr:EAL domain-containing protein [Caldisalinibacter kiritimatiensis]EOD00573.1 sensory box protein [Caldisalinibacter kiritimatiensis]